MAPLPPRQVTAESVQDGQSAHSESELLRFEPPIELEQVIPSQQSSAHRDLVGAWRSVAGFPTLTAVLQPTSITEQQLAESTLESYRAAGFRETEILTGRAISPSRREVVLRINSPGGEQLSLVTYVDREDGTQLILTWSMRDQSPETLAQGRALFARAVVAGEAPTDSESNEGFPTSLLYGIVCLMFVAATVGWAIRRQMKSV